MIYVIQIGNEPARLIEAASKKKQAIQFAPRVVVQAEKATASQVAVLMETGSKLEKTE